METVLPIIAASECRRHSGNLACPGTGITVVTSNLRKSVDSDIGNLSWCDVSGIPIVGEERGKGMDYVYTGEKLRV